MRCLMGSDLPYRSNPFVLENSFSQTVVVIDELVYRLDVYDLKEEDSAIGLHLLLRR